MNDNRDCKLKSIFPNLSGTPYKITSERSFKYNCFAWAAGDSNCRWEPDEYGFYFWPEVIPRFLTIETLSWAYELLGYQICDSNKHEEGFDKIAIYAIDGSPTHAAKQINQDIWTSKLGDLEDITHTLSGIEGEAYGKVARILRRPKMM